MAMSNPPPITAPLKLFGSRPEILRYVSKQSLILAGQTVEIVKQSSRESGLVGIRTRWGALYDFPKEFLLKEGQPEPEPIELEIGGSKRARSSRPTDARASALANRSSSDLPANGSDLATGGDPVASSLPVAIEPSQTLATGRLQEAPKSQELPKSQEPPKKPAPPVAALPPGVTIKTLESGEEVIVARDGTYRSVSSNAYRGSRQIAAQQALGHQWGTRTEIKCASGMVTVTLVQPSKRDAENIRAEVLKKIVAAATDGEFMSVCQKLRATKAERSLADRIRALRNVGTKSEDEWDVRRRIGVNIREMRSR
jgi:hypothetical protein